MSKANLFDVLGGGENMIKEDAKILRWLSSSLQSYQDPRQIKNSKKESQIIIKNTSNDYS